MCHNKLSLRHDSHEGEKADIWPSRTWGVSFDSIYVYFYTERERERERERDMIHCNLQSSSDLDIWLAHEIVFAWVLVKLEELKKHFSSFISYLMTHALASKLTITAQCVSEIALNFSYILPGAFHLLRKVEQQENGI